MAERGGDCFPKAYEVALREMVPQLDLEAPHVMIVHGTPIGRGPANRGLRFWHAWVELDMGGGDWLVLDESNDRCVHLRRDDYYDLGAIDPVHVWRYSLAQAIEHMERTRTYGPWVPDWETRGL